VRQILSDRRLAERLADQAKRRSVGHDWDRVADQVLSVYQGLVHERQVAGALPA
jgi:hypothetical protein